MPSDRLAAARRLAAALDGWTLGEMFSLDPSRPPTPTFFVAGETALRRRRSLPAADAPMREQGAFLGWVLDRVGAKAFAVGVDDEGCTVDIETDAGTVLGPSAADLPHAAMLAALDALGAGERE